jgi:hypothetical protein
MLASATVHAAEPGRFQLDVEIGGAFGLHGTIDGASVLNVPHQLAVGIDFGVALDARRRARLLLSPQLQWSDHISYVIAPLGFEVQLPIRRTPLHLYMRLYAGYAAMVYDVGPVSINSAAIVLPEFGARLILRRRFCLGLTPFSLPIFVGSFGDHVFTALYYRVLLSSGVVF